MRQLVSSMKHLILLGLTLNLLASGQAFDFNNVCNISLNQGLYARQDFSFYCCKEKHLQPPSMNYVRLSDLQKVLQECQTNMTAQNPQDDLSTSMWRVEGCKLKLAMGLKREDINFKSFVNFMTRDYTTENNVQSLIRDANKECPDADKETDFHKKIQAYNFCFYQNEQQICDEPTPYGLKKKEYFISLFNNGSTAAKSCPAVPGIWDQKSYCCNGKPTPNDWRMAVPWKYHSNRRSESDYSLTQQCYKSVGQLIRHRPLVKPNNTEHFRYRLFSLMDCRDVCEINPVIFKNESTSSELKLDFNKYLDAAFINQTTSVQKDMKEMALRFKTIVKMVVPDEGFTNQTAITLSEIENRYHALDDQLMKVAYYCAYFKGLTLMPTLAVNEYCTSKDSNQKIVLIQF